MDNKLNNMLEEFFKNTDVDSIEDANEKLKEFMEKYNNGEIEYKNTPLDDAYDLLEKAENAPNKKQAIKLAKEAYKKSNECFDAILFQANLEDDMLKRNEIIDKGLEFEKKRLEKQKYFEKENIGHFYGIYQTRPYIRGLYQKALNLAYDGKLTLAKDICKEILKLNENDNTGIRYVLMAIYAILEDEKEMFKLYKKYNEENFEMLFPIFVLYYKLGNEKKAIEYLKKVNEINPNLIKFLKGKLKKNDYIENGCYSEGDSSEIFMYFEEYMFLILTVPYIDRYIIQNLK